MGAGMSGMPLPRHATSHMQYPAQHHPDMLQGDIASMASALTVGQLGARTHPSGTAYSLCCATALQGPIATPNLCLSL